MSKKQRTIAVKIHSDYEECVIIKRHSDGTMKVYPVNSTPDDHFTVQLMTMQPMYVPISN